MNAILLLLWVALVFAPGYLTIRWFERARHELTRVEALALGFAFGTGWLTLEAIVLRWMDRLTLPWLLLFTAIIAFALFLASRSPSAGACARSDGRFFAGLAGSVLVGQLLVLLPLSGNVFGADSYTWAETATRLA